MMSPPTDVRETRHFFTVDVEEYFHVSAFESVIPREQWNRWPRRLDRSVPVLLEELERAGARATFFVLGWVAEHSPDIVREIVRSGHEIASHGFWHRRVHTMSPSAFSDDLRASKAALEDLIGAPVSGYRAPSFSIIPGCEWAFDVLLEQGFRYDSSLFPIRRRGYGYPNAPRRPHTITRTGGVLEEFPLATTSIAGLTIPAAGGGYLRQLPFSLVRGTFARASRQGVPATFYIHPWEIDAEQPRVPVGPLTRIRHYRGLSRTLGRLQALLAEFRFRSIGSYLNEMGQPTSGHAFPTAQP